MNFAPTMGKKIARRGARTSKKHDCGPHGKLTAKQIAAKVGMNVRAVQKRVRLGYKGEELLTPRYGRMRERVDAAPKSDVVATAMKLARAFPSGVPTAEQIMEARPMCKNAALNWRRAMAMEAGRVG